MEPTSGSRARVADFWDEVLARWLAGGDHLIPPLERWLGSYSGSGDGAVDLDHYPDPYVGDLRGVQHEPRLVLLGLNPGVGYDALQGPHGIWSERIRERGYSYCFDRSPAEDPVSWTALHGKPSAYWAKLTKFTQRWLQDPTSGVADILNFELYPWHSNKINAPMTPPADLIEHFVWEPVQEIGVPVVFAFGAAWFNIVESLGLPLVARFGAGGRPFPEPVSGGWTLGAYQLPSGQLAVVSAQPGYAGPPGEQRTELMRALLDELAERPTASPPGRVLPPPPPTPTPERPDEPAAQSAPLRVGAHLETVVLGTPAGAHVVTWNEENRPTVWQIDKPAEYAALVGRGLTARTVVEEGRYREVGLLDARTGALFVPERRPQPDGGMAGQTFQLTDPQPVAQLPVADLTAFMAWLPEVLLAAGSRGDFVVLEGGGWDFPREPYALFTCARDDSGTWLSHLEAAPAPSGSQVWPAPPDHSPGATLAAPATTETVNNGAALLVEAVSRWSPSPLMLGLTFGAAPHGPCPLSAESR